MRFFTGLIERFERRFGLGEFTPPLPAWVYDDEHDPEFWDYEPELHSIEVAPWFSAMRWTCLCGASGMIGSGSLTEHIGSTRQTVEIIEREGV